MRKSFPFEAAVIVLAAIILAPLIQAGSERRDSKERVQELLGVVENEERELGPRVEAAFELTKLGDRSCMPRLLMVLQNRYDALAVVILAAVPELNYREALPDLLNYQAEAQAKRIKMPGLVNTLLRKALRYCKNADIDGEGQVDTSHTQ